MLLRRLRLLLLASLCALAGVLTLSAPVLAFNVHVFAGSFGSEGTGAGQFMQPRGLAVNDSTHDVYVADALNARVEEFTSAGVYIGEFSPPGGFATGFESGPSGIAVDNSGNPLDPSAGDVYVVDRSAGVIDKFSETGTFEGRLAKGQGGVPFGEPRDVVVDSTGVVWMAQETVEGNRHTGFIESFSNAHENVFQSRILGFNAALIAINSDGSLYRASNNGFLRRSASGEVEQKEHYTAGNISGLAVDTSNNNVYFATGEKLEAYDSRNLPIENFGEGHLTASKGVAVDAGTHTVYVADAGTNQISIFDQKVLPDVSTGEEPTELQHEGTVTLDGSVNPDGIPVTSCEFEYGTDTTYGNTSPCEPAPGSGSGSVAVHAVVSGLTSLTSYHYRLIAGNENGSHPGIDRSFIVATQPSVGAESVFDVSADGATLAGTVNPGGTATTYRFEYGLSASYGESVSGNAGYGVSAVEVSAHPGDLQPGSTYHYRLVAESPLATVAGEDHTFVTQRAGGKEELPDQRAWEMVSPPNKQGADLDAPGGEDLVIAGVNGSAMTYVATGPTELQPAGNRAPEGVQLLSERGPEGWTTKVIATPHDASHEPATIGDSSEYKLFSPDLSVALVEPQGSLALSEAASGRTPYLRDNLACAGNPSGCYRPLVAASDVAPGVDFGVGPETGVTVEGATADLSHVILSAELPLTAGGGRGLYEWAGAHTYVGNMELGFRNVNVAHAVSDDGARVIGSGSSEGLQGLLMRDVVTGTTRKLDTVQAGAAGGGGEAYFQGASSDGSRVFFTDGANLTTDATALSAEGGGERDLYEYNVDTGRLSDLSVDPHSGEHANVQIVLGTSADGAYVYFAADGALTPSASPQECDSAADGALCNVYVRHEGQTHLVATLSHEDAPWGLLSQQPELRRVSARVSPNGEWLAFMSNRDLTSYDTRDAKSGNPDEEVYLYDAGTGSLVCASCDPTGARPVGEFVTASTPAGETTPLVNNGTLWNDIGLAATVPAWTKPTIDQAVYQSRYLSDSGRLFFNSDSALVPQDSNGTWDVYEYEPPEVGSCQTASVTFSAASNGCVGLISSGGAHDESIFMDASEGGDDVFFLTGAGLVPADYDGGLDVYDAHACSTQSPCAPAPPATPPPCSTGDACKAAPTPQPGIFGAPSSETFAGAGNLGAAAKAPSTQSKSLTRAQKLARALKACHKKKGKAKRLSCERQAKKRYGRQTTKSVPGKSVSSRTGR